MLRPVRGRCFGPSPPSPPHVPTRKYFDAICEILPPFCKLSYPYRYYPILVRTYSQLDPPQPPILGAPNLRAQPPPPPSVPFQWPTAINDPFTSRLRQYSLEEQADISGFWSRVPESFAQLKSDFHNHNFLEVLGKFAVDDPSKIDRLALANLRENKRARNNLASLHAARSCLYGSRGLGDKKWFSDKPGVASRLKTQAQRRQFRLGLVANVAFYNRLNLLDLTSWLDSGTSSDLAAVRPDATFTVSQFQDLVRRLAPLDILRLVAPDKAARLSGAVSDISVLSDYEQALCNHLATSEALEPTHAVLGTLLRTGADFKAALLHHPIQLATQAIAPLCIGRDVDGTLFASKVRQPTRGSKPRPPARTPGPYPAGVCFDFQKGWCSRDVCKYLHRCASCRSTSHGKLACPSSTSTG